jgi:hypothetical protein
MTDTDKPPFDALGHNLVIGSCRTGKTHIPWAPTREGMSSENYRFGGLE